MFINVINYNIIMVSNNNKKPKFIRPFIRAEDVTRFHGIFLASGLSTYSELITLLLDIYEESGNENFTSETLQIGVLVNEFKGKLKEISPTLAIRFEEIIKNGTGN